MIFKENDMGSDIFMIVSGMVKIYKNSEDGKSYEIAHFNATEFFGEMSFLDNIYRSANAVAASYTQLIGLDEENFKRFSTRYSSAAFRFLKNITLENQKRLRLSNEKLVKNYGELLKAHNTLTENRNFLYNVIGNSSEMIIVLDPQEKTVIFNSGAETSLKIKAAELIGKHIEILFYETQYQTIINELSSAKSIHNREIHMRAFDGKKLITNFSAFILNPQKGNNGDGIVIMAHNVTEKKFLERQIMQNDKMILLGKTVSEIVHDIKNPLTIITLARDCIFFRFEDLHDEEFEKDVNQIDESVARIQKIITNTLDFVKVVPSSQDSINLCAVIQNSITHSKANKKAEIVKIIFDDKLPDINVIGNAAQLEQVFINLITNAIYAIPVSKGGTVKIAMSRKGNRIFIDISDTGSGMNEDVLANIFEPFFTTKPAGEGTGLGLSICQAIISQHKGEICCKSVVDEGTTFTISFPY